MAKVVLIHGEGKGKTTNAIGYISEYFSKNKDIVVAQFLKTGKDCGEYKFFKNKGIRWMFFGKDEFYVSEKQKEEYKLLIKEAIKKLKEELNRKKADILLLDELGIVLSFEIINWTEIEDIFELVEDLVIITGRKIPLKILKKADKVIEVKEIKHPYQKSIQARKGIEY